MTGAWLIQVVGAVVVFAVLQDVFFTVLFPASGHGLLWRPLTRWPWKAFALVGRRLPFERRRAFLTYSGPVQITVNLGVWILLLVTGWALIFRPALRSQIVASSGTTDTSWATAFYYSGYVLTTLGLGDVVARDGLFRLLTVVEAGIGFATVSMAITYFLSVYWALTERKVSAALLHHRTYDTGDAASLLAGLARDGGLPGAPDELVSMAGFVQRALETHASYPVLRYFHQQRTYYALPAGPPAVFRRGQPAAGGAGPRPLPHADPLTRRRRAHRGRPPAPLRAGPALPHAPTWAGRGEGLARASRGGGRAVRRRRAEAARRPGGSRGGLRGAPDPVGRPAARAGRSDALRLGQYRASRTSDRSADQLPALSPKPAPALRNAAAAGRSLS